MSAPIRNDARNRLDAAYITPDQYSAVCHIIELAWHHAEPDEWTLGTGAYMTSPEARRGANLIVEALGLTIAPNPSRAGL